MFYALDSHVGHFRNRLSVSFKDSRGNIFFDICKMVDYHKPEF